MFRCPNQVVSSVLACVRRISPVYTFRSWLQHLADTRRLATVDKPVDLRFELAAVAKYLDGKQPVLFKRVQGHEVPVVSGIAGSRSLLAEALGCSVAWIVEHFAAACAHPLPSQRVSAEQAPVQERVITSPVDLMKTLPIPVHHEHDAGPYITAGLFIVRNPVTGQQNVAIHRLQVTGPNRLGVLLLPRHTQHLWRQAEAAGRPLECAIVIGVDPATLLASQANVPLGVDELAVAGALRNEPLRVVRGVTVDVDVPADAEIVLEGRILPQVREPEGPFGEFPKYYGPRSEKEVVEVTAITSRTQPFFHTILPAGWEHLLLGAIPREASLLAAVRQTVPTVTAVHLTPGGTCRFHAAIAMRKQHEGQAKNAILAAFANNFDLKHVVVVDDDVDIFQAEEVE
ncbi:MAG: UbiD family decarboxylase, partial [Alicyclobacillus sp.]|nr:UbiD family decarboxylase [Alicyclobacillus sp.]